MEGIGKPTRVRVDKVYTLLQASVVKTFGTVNDATLDRIRQMLMDLWTLGADATQEAGQGNALSS